MELNTYQHSEASQTFFKRRAVHKVNVLCGKMRNYLHLKNKVMWIKISELDEILTDFLILFSKALFLIPGYSL